MPTFLHVGCGQKRQAQTTRGFNQANWHETRLDIDPAVSPDILGNITGITAVADSCMDALYSSHNIEHLYAHEVPLALREFRQQLHRDSGPGTDPPDIEAVLEEWRIGRVRRGVLAPEAPEPHAPVAEGP